jgi:lysyl-tRNA synthetase class 2
LAYLTLLPGGEGVYSLDLTRRSQHAPNAIMELLVIETLVQLKSRGASSISLNFSTFSSLAASHSGNAARTLASRWFQMGTLEAFNTKFRPSWAPRYAAFPSLFALPDVVYAILSVEGVNRMLINACARGVRHAAHSARTSEQPAGATLRGENAFQ